VDSSALSYDPKGNLTVDNTKSHKYTWDFDNRMSAADTDGDNVDDVTCVYDAQGRRIAKTSGGSTTVYVLSGWQVIGEYSSGAAPTSPTEKYVYASYIDEPVLKDGTGGTVYYHRNSQYSVASLTSASGAVVERYGYEPYGELTILAPDGSTVRASSSYANTYTYTGRRWDADLGLYYFRARYYDPALGRFVGRDPAGRVATPHSYQFLNSSGVSLNDPTGLFPPTLMPTDVGGILRRHAVAAMQHRAHVRARKELYIALWDLCEQCVCTTKELDKQCDFFKCINDAEQMSYAIYFTLEYNSRWVLFQGEKYRGYFCYEWAYALHDAVKWEAPSGCFAVRMEHIHNGSVWMPRVHAWLSIRGLCSHNSVYVDDGFVATGKHVHLLRPIPDGWTLPERPHDYAGNPVARDDCNVPRAYDEAGNPLAPVAQ
ncbi:MAG: RHS repeat-associated core domain-containing protein, partial [Candidatus Zixiibacteriota bacterium]